MFVNSRAIVSVMLANHPDRDQIQLANVLAALGNPVRLRILATLADGAEHTCGSILPGMAKSTLTHHWRVLRDAGVIRQIIAGREHHLSLRHEDLEARFPGLLPALLAAAGGEGIASPPAP
ncbi:ArsR/SmtB family transcription factor [Nocardia puris]|uniref:ArsR/SmtB family transcription factor n=1 Tax=Nocardia puris TaxID=208602 RepID=UPI002B4ACB52|nr:helix-turn-helix domain-containing protein [Nocardia puris]